MDKTLEEMRAEAAIRDVHMRYCRAVDRMDFALLRSCFHEDAETDYGHFGGSVEAFLAGAEKGLSKYDGTTHFIGNQLIEVEGDAAWAEHYTLATHRLPAEDAPLRDFVTSLRYIDRFERRDGGWKIARRQLVLDWCRTETVGERTGIEGLATGRRDRSDPSYAGRGGGARG